MNSEVEAYKIEDNCSYNNEGSYMCSPVYYYQVNGKSYTCSTGYSSSAKVSNENKTVYYNSENPAECVNSYSAEPNFISIIFLLIPVIFIFVGIKGIMDVNARIKKIQYLASYGKLIKGIPYKMERTGRIVNHREILAPAIDYTLDNGTVIHLVGDPRHDYKMLDGDGCVDLLLDPNDPNNYYIDFEIN